MYIFFMDNFVFYIFLQDIKSLNLSKMIFFLVPYVTDIQSDCIFLKSGYVKECTLTWMQNFIIYLTLHRLVYT